MAGADASRPRRATGGRDPGFTYLASFVVLGLSLTFLGPVLTTLRDQVGVSTATISVLFGAQSLGYLAGAVLGGRGYDLGLGHRLMAGSLVGAAVAFLIISLAGSLAVLIVFFVLLGFTGSVVDVGGNALLVWTRGAGVGPMINALHFMFAVGALACPLLVNRSLAWSGDLKPAAWIAAVAAILVAIVLLRRDEPAPGAHEQAEGRAPAPRRLLIVISVFFVLYVGVELGFSGWVYAYAEDLHIGGGNGPAWLTATFWGFFALGRLVAIPMAAVVAPRRMLFGACTLTVASAAVLVIVGSGQLVWVATALLGIGLAPQFATMIAFAERHVAITGSATSWFIGAVAIGGFVLPWLIGQLFDHTGSDALPAAVLISAAATLAWLVVVSRMFGRRSGLAAAEAAAGSAAVGVVPRPSLLSQKGLELGG